MKRVSPALVLGLLLAAVFSLAAVLQTRLSSRPGGGGRRGGSDNLLKILLGDGRRLFANHFFTIADVYFHSGYYPSVFDRSQAPKDSRHLTQDGHADEAEEEHEGHDAEAEHEKAMAFLGPPRDWIERFGRHFMITAHTHLQHGAEREILPWLRLSAELDPQRIETYTVSAYWLRSRLGKVKEAEQFLREGLRANPASYELLFELGRLYHENHHDLTRARNIWELALRRWQEQEGKKTSPNVFVFEEITANLARLEEAAGNFDSAIHYLEMAKGASPNPAVLQRQIEELKQKRQAQPQPLPGRGPD